MIPNPNPPAIYEPSPTFDADVLDRLAYLLSAEEWPGASGMEDVAELVAATGRDINQAGAEWPRH